MKKPDRFKLCGYMPFDTVRKFGFIMPIFSKEDGTKGVYLQIADDTSEVIGNFSMIENSINIDCESATENLFAAVNTPLIYAFKDRSGQISCGTLTEISSCLTEFMHSEKSDSAINFQIAELIGSGEEKKRARRNMLTEIDDITSKDSFERTLLILSMHNHLSSAYDKDKQLRELFLNRTKIQFDIKDEFDVRISFDKACSDDAARKYNEILSTFLTDELSDLKKFSPENKLFYSETPSIQQNLDMHTALNKIKNTRTQEERIAIMIYYILADREIGRYLLNTYQNDRAKFANSALRLIRESFSFKEEALGVQDLKASALIEKLYRSAVYFNRGRLILYFAQYLSRYPNVNSTIEKIVSSSDSFYIHDVRNEIEHILLSHRPLGRSQ